MGKISTVRSQEPEYGPRKPTKEELLSCIDKCDHQITNLENQLKSSKQSTVSDSVIVDEDKYLQDMEIKKKPLMHQMFFSNFVKSIEAHSKFDSVKYFPKSESEPELPLQDESFWKKLHDQQHESHEKIIDQVFEAIKKNVDREKKWLHNTKTSFVNAQKKWLKQKNVEPPPKEWLNLAAIPPPMKTKQEREFVFLDDNGYVEDPLAEEKDYYSKEAELGRWNSYEVETFKQKYHIYPKNFRKISEFLPNKTVGDCINFYYHNKKDPILKHVIEEVKAKSRMHAQWAEAQVSSGGKPSILNADGSHVDASGRHASDDEMEDSADDAYKPSRGRSKRKKGKDTDSDWTDGERAHFIEAFEAFPKDWKKIAQVLGNKTASQCKSFFSQNKQELGLSKTKSRRGGRRNTRSSSKADERKANNRRSGSGKRSKKPRRSGNYWNKTEKSEFLSCLQLYGKDWQSIAEHMENKTETQILKYYQSLQKSLGLPVSEEDEDAFKKKKGSKRKTRSQLRQTENGDLDDSSLPTDNDLRFFAEIASIKSSIDFNSSSAPRLPQEGENYSSSTLFDTWLIKKYLSGLTPNDSRPAALEDLATKSAQQLACRQEMPEDIRKLIGGCELHEEKPKERSLGSFWGDQFFEEDEENLLNVSGPMTS